MKRRSIALLRTISRRSGLALLLLLSCATSLANDGRSSFVDVNSLELLAPSGNPITDDLERPVVEVGIQSESPISTTYWRVRIPPSSSPESSKSTRTGRPVLTSSPARREGVLGQNVVRYEGSLNIGGGNARVLSVCAPDEDSGALVACHHADFLSRDNAHARISWAQHGWFATTQYLPTPGGERRKGFLVRVERIVRGGTPGEPGITSRPLTLRGPYESRDSINEIEENKRHMALHAFDPARARLVFQSGITNPNGVDDNLLVVDLCYVTGSESPGDEAAGYDGMIVRCDDASAVGDARVEDNECDENAPPIGLDCSRVRTVAAGKEAACLKNHDAPNESYLPHSHGWEGAPGFSPDGRWLAYLRSDPSSGADCTMGASLEHSDESLPLNLWVVRNARDPRDMDRSTSAVNLTEDLGFSVLEFEWSCDGRCIVAKTLEDDATVLYQFDLGGPVARGPDVPSPRRWVTYSENGPKRPVLTARADEYLKVFRITSSGRTLYYAASSMHSRVDRLYRCTRPDTGTATTFECAVFSSLAGFLDSEDSPVVVRTFDQLRLDRPELNELFRRSALQTHPSPSADEQPAHLQGRVFLPPCLSEGPPSTCPAIADLAGQVPVLVWVHGGPHANTTAARDPFLDLFVRGHGEEGRLGAHGFIVIAPNAAGSSGFGEAYRRAPFASETGWGGAPYLDVLQTVRVFSDPSVYLREQMQSAVAGEPPILMGGSFGGYIGNLVQSGRSVDGKPLPALRGIVSLYGVFDIRKFAEETDQQWFPLRQFGYNGASETAAAEGYFHRGRKHDPAFNWGCRSFAGETGRAPFACPEVNAIKSGLTPMMVVHGDQDFRVPLSESQKLAFAMHVRNRAANAGARWMTPYRVCEVRAGDHGFSLSEYESIYEAVTRWFGGECHSMWRDGQSCGVFRDGAQGSRFGQASDALDCSPAVDRQWRNRVRGW